MGVLFTLSLASAAGLLGVWLALVILPALFLYLNTMVEEIVSGREPKLPGTEFSRWIGVTWCVFSLHTVISKLIEPHQLFDDVFIPDGLEASED